VRPGSESEYLEAVRELASLAEARGWHLWVFRRPDRAGSFLEFSESRSRETHRSLAERPQDEQGLEARIRAVAEYEPGAWELWEEVR
jgi:hypothetical protein